MNPAHTAWTTEEVALLGTMSDAEVARRTGRSHAAVYAKRRYHGVAAGFAHERRWTKRG